MTTKIKRPMCGECVFYQDLYCFYNKPARLPERGGFRDDGEVQVKPTRVACHEWFPLSGRMQQLALARVK
jgi:hypothetical protein